jgi:opacity protein-like surface antigen
MKNLIALSVKRRKWYVGILIALLTIGLVLPTATPGLASVASHSPGTIFAYTTIWSLLISIPIGYGIWEVTANRDNPRYFNGEFYAGVFGGAGFYPSQELRFGTPSNGLSVRSMKFDPSVAGGMKIGYFFNSCKFLGLEYEQGVSLSPVRRQNVTLSPPFAGSNKAVLPSDNWLNFYPALHLVGRLGFLPDQELSFGRLQPYVGFGPILLFNASRESGATSVNWGLDVMAGVRYMVLKNVSAFLEYKYTHVWDADLLSQPLLTPNLNTEGNAVYNFGSHKVVVGMAYHF